MAKFTGFIVFKGECHESAFENKKHLISVHTEGKSHCFPISQRCGEEFLGKYMVTVFLCNLRETDAEMLGEKQQQRPLTRKFFENIFFILISLLKKKEFYSVHIEDLLEILSLLLHNFL